MKSKQKDRERKAFIEKGGKKEMKTGGGGRRKKSDSRLREAKMKGTREERDKDG